MRLLWLYHATSPQRFLVNPALVAMVGRTPARRTGVYFGASDYVEVLGSIEEVADYLTRSVASSEKLAPPGANEAAETRADNSGEKGNG